MDQKAHFKQTVHNLYQLLQRKQKISFFFILLIMIISAILSQMTPLAIGYLTDDVLNTANIHFISTLPILIFILAVTIFNEAIKVIRRLIVEDTSTSVEKMARVKAIRSLLMAPLSYFRLNMRGNIHGRLNRSLEGTTNMLKLIFMDFAPSIFTSIAAITVIFIKLPFLLALIMMLVIPIGIGIVLRQISTQRGIRVDLLETKSAMDGTMVELTGGVDVIRISDSVDFECGRFEDKSEYLRKKEMKHHKAMAKYDCFKFINEALFSVIIIGASVFMASKGIISIGTVLTAYLCFTQLLGPLQELHRILDELSESTVLAEEYFKIISMPKDFSYALPSNVSDELDHSNCIININDLHFHYEETSNEPIIDGLNLTIENGEFLGIAGPSGCGKSSFIKIISKLEAAEGCVFLNGKNLLMYNRKELSKIIALVPQNPFLVAGTIYDNIVYGLDDKPDLALVKEAARKAYINNVIEKLPGGYDFWVSESGNNLSGGQRQRIALARIFLRKPQLLILDEATSALDNTSEKHIQTEIEKLKAETGTTIISIAHRLSTLKNCDRIIVFDKGQIVQEGDYDTLTSRDGIFRDMYLGILK